MRRLMTGAACAAILLLAPACGNQSQTASGAPGAASRTPAAAASPTVDVAANTSQICGDVKQLNTDYPTKLTTLFSQVVQAVANDDQATGQQYIDQMNGLTKEWVSNLQAEAAKASSSELQKTVNDLAVEVAKLESADASMQDMNNALQSGSANLAKLCG